MRRRDFLLAAVAMLLKPTAAQSNEQRLALLIGNASYRQYRCKNPCSRRQRNEGGLDTLNFETTLVEDANLREMIGALQHFSVQARRHNVRLFYFAGHGLQIRGGTIDPRRRGNWIPR